MSRQATKINITEEQRTALENGYRNGATHSFRMRCLMVLGKAYGLSNAAAGARAGQTYQRVMHWVKRFQSDGIAGLRNRPGNGRRRIISTRKDRGLHIFYLPPYSPHLNIVETLWRVLKGKWIQPHHYGNKHGLFSTVEDILSNVGKQYMINFCRPAA